MKIAVIGGGIFGSTTAYILASRGAEVDLFERNDDLLKEASGINQYRLHRGYHYPRSVSTAISSRDAEESFVAEYGDAVLDTDPHYYCIAQEKSKVTGEEFIEFCKTCALEYEHVDLDVVNKDMVDVSVKVRESLVDPVALKKIVKEKLESAGVTVHLNKAVTIQDLEGYDYVVNATYANLNNTVQVCKHEYQYELCEKPLLKLPEQFARKSIVILDGPFMCIDPYADTPYHVMGNVVHAIHHTNVGCHPEIPEGFEPLLNQGVVENPFITNIDKFLKSASQFFPGIEKAEHVGSMFTFRTVLPNVDKTDERPTEVHKVDDRNITIFSGKIGNCVDAAYQVAKIVDLI